MREPKKKNNKVLIVFLVIVGLIAWGVVFGNTDTAQKSSQATQPTTENKPAEASKTAKIGQPARDGKFEFTVKSIECGKASVGTNQFLTKTAQGQYCLLNVTVKNIGNEKQSLFSANQKLLKGETEYSADDTATLYAAPQGSSWYSDINPGNSVDGAIVFDVPKGVTPSVAELHDSAFSGGVKVTLQ